MNEWHVNIREDRLKLTAALALRIPASPEGFLRQLIKKKRILINSETASVETVVHYLDHVLIKPSQRMQQILSNSPLQPEDILYEDSECIILNKRSGLATHGAPGHEDNLIVRASKHFSLRREKFRIAPIQRLDMGTSGAVLIGKGKKSISALGKLMMSGGITKRYLALVAGSPPKSGEFKQPVRAKGRSKEALTFFQRLETSQNYSLLSLELATGRQHQIRQQLAACGHPVAGDKRYGGDHAENKSRLMLHCRQLAFQNPVTGDEVDINCPPGDDFHRQLSAVNFVWGQNLILK